VIRFSDYISLPTLEEYLVELTPSVAVRRVQGEKVLKILGDHPDLAFHDPLIMVDGVPMFDMSVVLGVSPRLVDRLEIVNAPYVVGNLTFGGIMNVVTRNGDLGMIDLPSSGLMLNYILNESKDDPEPLDHRTDPRLPDVRNTIYWNPSLVIQPGGSDVLTFAAPSRPGTYEVHLRGYDGEGLYVAKKVVIQVD
jgi:hypothetical protein